jgi:hypothetical protein
MTLPSSLVDLAARADRAHLPSTSPARISFYTFHS